MVTCFANCYYVQSHYTNSCTASCRYATCLSTWRTAYLDPVESNGRRQHGVRDGKGVAEGDGLGAELGAEVNALALQ